MGSVFWMILSLLFNQGMQYPYDNTHTSEQHTRRNLVAKFTTWTSNFPVTRGISDVRKKNPLLIGLGQCPWYFFLLDNCHCG